MPLHQQVRAVSLLQFMGEEQRKGFLAELEGRVQHCKSTQVMVLLYEKWKYGYDYSYRLLDQLHQNPYFCEMSGVHQAHIKMLFTETIKGQFCPYQDTPS